MLLINVINAVIFLVNVVNTVEANMNIENMIYYDNNGLCSGERIKFEPFEQQCPERRVIKKCRYNELINPICNDNCSDKILKMKLML